MKCASLGVGRRGSSGDGAAVAGAAREHYELRHRAWFGSIRNVRPRSSTQQNAGRLPHHLHIRQHGLDYVAIQHRLLRHVEYGWNILLNR